MFDIKIIKVDKADDKEVEKGTEQTKYVETLLDSEDDDSDEDLFNTRLNRDIKSSHCDEADEDEIEEELPAAEAPKEAAATKEAAASAPEAMVRSCSMDRDNCLEEPDEAFKLAARIIEVRTNTGGGDIEIPDSYGMRLSSASSLCETGVNSFVTATMLDALIYLDGLNTDQSLRVFSTTFSAWFDTLPEERFQNAIKIEMSKYTRKVLPNRLVHSDVVRRLFLPCHSPNH